MYDGVPGNLVAFACLLSLRLQFDGEVSFKAKTGLIEYYRKKLGAIHFGGGVMIIRKNEAAILINKYFNF